MGCPMRVRLLFVSYTIAITTHFIRLHVFVNGSSGDINPIGCFVLIIQDPSEREYVFKPVRTYTY